MTDIEKLAEEMFEFDLAAMDASVDVWPKGHPHCWADASEAVKNEWRERAAIRAGEGK